jgi:hypothetical protein
MTFPSRSSLSLLGLVTFPSVGFAVIGCDGPGICALERVYGVRVTVVGGAEAPATEGGAGGAGGTSGTVPAPRAGAGGAGNAAATCLASVSATAEDYTEELQCSVDGANCVCVGLTEIPGEFAIRAQLGELDETKTVKVRPEGCNVSTKLVTFFGE